MIEMNIQDGYIFIQAIEEYELIASELQKLVNKDFDTVFTVISKKINYNCYNYDGTLFDFNLSRIIGTIKKGDNNKPILDNHIELDISNDYSGFWIDTTIENLYSALRRGYTIITGLSNEKEFSNKGILEYMKNCFMEEE